MGIVVAVFMLLGLLMVTPWKSPGMRGLRDKPLLGSAVAIGLWLAGMWNALWHGLRHLGDFWGWAAFASGIVMAAVAVIILVERGHAGIAANVLINGTYTWIRRLAMPLTAALLAFFLLYAVTLVRFNLGYPIIGS